MSVDRRSRFEWGAGDVEITKDEEDNESDNEESEKSESEV